MTDSPSVQTIAQLLDIVYGITGEIERISKDPEDYRVRTSGNDFLLRLCGPEIPPDTAQIEHLAVERLAEELPELKFPRVILTRTKEAAATFNTGDRHQIRARLFEYIDARPWYRKNPSEEAIFIQLGRVLAKMDTALAHLVHPHTRRTHDFDLLTADRFRKHIHKIEGLEKRQVIDWAFHLYAAIAKPLLDKLPRSPVHSNITRFNTLVVENAIAGFTDFDFCIENPVICSLASSLACLTLGQPDPLKAAAAAVGAYHEIRPLSLNEIHTLFPLMCARLALSVLQPGKNSGRKAPLKTDDDIWDSLDNFQAAGPAQAAILLCAHTDLTPYADRGASPKDLVNERRLVTAPCSLPSYDPPLKIIHSHKQYLYDYNGRPFLDFRCRTQPLGHCYPEVVKAGQQQMALFDTGTDFLFDSHTSLSHKICDTLPRGLNTCFFTGSKEQAITLAIRIAGTITGKRDILFTGNSRGLPGRFSDQPAAIGPQALKAEAFRIHPHPVPDTYRGAAGDLSGRDAQSAAAAVLDQADSLDNSMAAFMSRSLFSSEGIIPSPKGYLKTIFEKIRGMGGLCILDETLTGFGRTGSGFWGFELLDAAPDILVIGPSIANGYPMAAVITSRETARFFCEASCWHDEYHGSSVGFAMAGTMLNVIEKKQFQKKALQTGKQIFNRLAELKAEHPMIGDIRGTGLFWGIELVRDHNTLEPAAKKAEEMVARMKNRGILLEACGAFGNVIALHAPLTVRSDDAAMFLRAFEDALCTMENAG